MLKITVEYIPFGDESKKEILATADIINDGTGNAKEGNYKYFLFLKGKLWREGSVKEFPRQLNSWDLLYRCLLDGVGKRILGDKKK